MPASRWDTSQRRGELPADWPHLRSQVLERDGHRCRHMTNGARCTARATDVDHIVDRHDHSLDNLQSLCHDHHQDKTVDEAHTAMRELRAKAKHPIETHPLFRR